jgi:hypothetical protein
VEVRARPTPGSGPRRESKEAGCSEQSQANVSHRKSEKASRIEVIRIDDVQHLEAISLIKHMYKNI